MTRSEQLPKIKFADFVLCPAARTLHRHGVRLKLHRQPFEVLLMLIERRDEVVTRKELEDRLWPGTPFVDSEHGLNTAVKKLRRVLGDSADEPRFIETVPRIGYRFVCAIEESAEAEAEKSSQPAIEREAPLHEAAAPAKSLPIGTQPRVRWHLALAGMAAAALLILLFAVTHGHWSSTDDVRAERPQGKFMLAVLPFGNLTGDPGQDYLSEGLTEEMIDQLGRAAPDEFGVIARSSVQQYKTGNQPLQKIGGELGVEYILEGSVRRDSQRARIAAQLVRVKDQKVIWTRQYDRELSNLLSVQSEIAEEIADEIQLTLGGSHRTPIASNPPNTPPYEAYDLYLQGRFFLNERTADGFNRAADYFQRAIAKDPNYAQAYAGLADVYALMSSWNAEPPTVYTPKARAAALKALALNQNLAEAHTALALIAENYDWDWQTAEKEYRRAIELDPNYATAHHWYAECLAVQGHFDQAFAEIDRARQLDPLSLIISTDRAAFLYFSRQYDRAIPAFQAVLDMQPGFPRAHMIVDAELQGGKASEALRYLNQLEKGATDAWHWTQVAETYGLAGHKAVAEHAFRELQQLYSKKQATSNQMAVACMGLRDNDRAIEYLQKAFAEHTISTSVNVDPIFDPLRKDPRFQTIIHNMHLQ